MSALSAGPVEISYTVHGKTVTFPVETIITVAQFIPVPDESRRATAYVNVIIRLKATLGAENQSQGKTTDDAMDVIKEVLTTQGGKLVCKGAGCGDISVNVDGGRVKDVRYGPCPTLLLWRPLGQMACDVEWEVSTCVPICGEHVKYNFAPYEFVWSLSVDHDRSGYSTMRRAGHIAIAINRVSPDSDRIADSADNHLENYRFPLVRGFRRLPVRRTVSPDRSRIDFEVVDEEMGPNYPPPDTIDAKASQTVTLEGSVFSVRWRGALRCEFEMPKDRARTIGMEYFLNLIEERIAEPVRGKDYIGVMGGRGRAFAIVRSIEITEPNIYGRNITQFGCNYLLVTSLRNILLHTSLFKPVKDNDYDRWAQSVYGSAMAIRGTAGIKFDPASEAVISLCQNKERGLQPQLSPRPLQGARPRQRELQNPVPPPDASWVTYECALRFESDDNAVVMKTLPTEPVNVGQERELAAASGQPPAGVNQVDNQAGVPIARLGTISSYTGGGAGDTVYQVRGRPMYYAYLEGSARRLGFLIEPPWLVSVTGARVVPMNGPGYGFAQQQIGSYFGVNEYAAVWRLKYVLVEDPKGRVEVAGTPFPLG